MFLPPQYTKIFILILGVFISISKIDAQTVQYSNQDPGAPSTYEACPGSRIKLTYTNFNRHPNKVELTDTTGASFVVPNATITYRTISNNSGTIEFNIPFSAGTGRVTLSLNNRTLSNDLTLVIHNPLVDFFAQANPICASDTVELLGFPSGGDFSINPASTIISSYPHLIVNNSIQGGAANWSNNNDSSKSIILDYSYRPRYINHAQCLQKIKKTKRINIRDNRLDEVNFNYIIRNPTSSDSLTLKLNDTIISNVSPDLLNTNSFFYPVSFSGTYTTLDHNGDYKFIMSQANTSNPITLSYNNGGCIGEATGILNVYDPLRMIGLLDTVCSGATPFIFKKDSLSNYAYSTNTTTTTTTTNGIVAITQRIYEYNRVTAVTTDNPIYQGAIRSINPSSNSHPDSTHYLFTPQSIPQNIPLNGTGVTAVSMQMLYTSTIIEHASGNLTDTINIKNIIAFDTIYIAARPIPKILNLDSTYCPNSDDITIQTQPAFEGSRTYFKLRGNDALGYNLQDTLQSDTIFAPTDHYNNLVPLNNRHLDIALTYTVDRYGCKDSTIAYTKIIAKGEPIFYPPPAYCINDNPSPLTPTYAPTSFTPFSAVFTFSPTSGLDSITKLFDPNISGPGNHPVTLQMVDNFGCRSEYTDSLYVRIPPEIRLEVDNSIRTTFCSNEINVPLNTVLVSGNAVSSIAYYGPGVTGATFDPSAIFTNNNGLNTNGGTALISVLYTDIFGCEGRDDASLEVRPIPVLRLDNLRRCCGNATDFIIKGSVKDTANNFQVKEGAITGDGVVLIDGTYYYSPIKLTVNSVYFDTVRYTYNDAFGCANTISEIVQIDSIPVVSITGLNPEYCIDDTTDQLVGMPDTTVLYNRVVFDGPGVNPNTGILTPSLAGTGTKIVSYLFEDKHGCEGIAFESIVIHDLPTPLFEGFLPQYCTAGALDSLVSLNNLSPLTTSYYFGGAIISDPSGILDPNSDGSGLKTIYYTYTDSVGCSNTDSVNIFIHPSPKILIDGLDSAYCFYSLADNITVAPASTTFYNNDPGFSIRTSNSLRFDPGIDTGGMKKFTLLYSEPSTNCKDTLSARTFVYKPPTPSYTGLDTFYCETRDVFSIAGIPTGGIFSGQGIVNNTFTPAIAGGGRHVISYTINDTSLYNADALVCQVDTTINVIVRPLPVPTILSPVNNSRFCSTDTSQTLLTGTQYTWNTFISWSGGVDSSTSQIPLDTPSTNPLTIRYYNDTTYRFDPSLVVEGTHFITYIATDSITGCQDSIHYTYIVDEYIRPFFSLDSAYCESADSVILFGVPGGGVFLRNNDTINGEPPYFIPNSDYANNIFLLDSIIDTITYRVEAPACSDSVTRLVRINPVPQISFRGDTTQTHNTYCLGMDSIPLTPNIRGGIFTGNGILFGTSAFIPDIARVGHHPIYYNYTDTATNCSNQYIDTFSVFGMPDANFSVIGGCQLDSIAFWPNNTILGLNNYFNNNIIDSITSILWEFAPGVTDTGSHQSNVIDPLSHFYASPGIYQTKLIVANQIHCVDTQTIRLVISPKVSTFPYDQSFEASSADWYADSRGSSHSLLWEWGIDSTPQGIESNLNNRFWATQLNASYSQSEDAWVYSPCFDIDSLTRPMLKLDYWCDTRTAADGAVLEYQEENGDWKPLGLLERGINWFNSSIITGQPGDQTLAPIGWSGKSGKWTDARYKLDDLGHRKNVRFRVAFGSPSVNLGGAFYDGFGFDNFWVGSRTRNVLLETTSNIYEQSTMPMEMINNHVYQLVYHSPINQDLIMLQYHCAEPNANDMFHLSNPVLPNARTYFYGIAEAGRAYIDGKTDSIPRSRYLNANHFEKNMLASPKFDIKIDNFHHNSAGVFTLEATVIALENITTPSRYRINTVITEDSLSYPNGVMVHSVARQDDQATNLYTRSWEIGDTQKVSMYWDHGANTAYQVGNFQAVVFIQSELTREVFQAKSSRDVSGYLVGVDPVAAEAELNEINNMNLFPNPARNDFNVTFKAPLEHDYSWKLVGINGVEHKTGRLNRGDQTIQINNYDFPTGVYVFMVYNGNVFSQRKVIINQE